MLNLSSRWSTPHFARFTPGGKSQYLWYRGWTSAQNLAPSVIQTPNRLARSETLYRLSYPDSTDWRGGGAGNLYLDELLLAYKDRPGSMRFC